MPGPGLRSKHGATEATSPPALAVDEAFARYVAPDALTRALASRDPSRLADVGLQLAEAESILKRRRRGITAEQVLRQAEQRAIETGDKTTLDRLARAATHRNDKSAAARLSQGGEGRPPRVYRAQGQDKAQRREPRRRRWLNQPAATDGSGT